MKKPEKKGGFSILVGVDFSPASGRALKEAVELAERTSGTLTVLHVRPVSDVRAAVLEERGDLLSRSSQELKRELERHYAERFASLEVPTARIRLVRGRASTEICKEASKGYDLLVLGREGRAHGLVDLLGGTAQKVLVCSPIPVVVVPF